MERNPCVYILANKILANKPRGTLYVGVTSDLRKRVWQHRNELAEGFTRRYRLHRLVWYEQHSTMRTAIHREKTLKRWRRVWKLELVEKENHAWRDLYDTLG